MFVKPFIKWVGGKGQLLPQLESNLPVEIRRGPFTYIEPFVGGGAMLFFMLQHFSQISRVVINDINKNLTDAYNVVKDYPENLIDELRNIERQYQSIKDEKKRCEYYLEKRNKYNEEVLECIEKTAVFIFLNRTCFNGLYRENSRGRFNVPFGRYVNPTICNDVLIRADSELLNRFDVEILNGDYRQIENYIDDSEQTFIYFDPPYRPLSNTSNFNAYDKEPFNDDKQKELACMCHRLSDYPRIKWMLSNSDCSSVNPNDTFFEDLYDGFYIKRVYASRMVNADSTKRGKLTELLITNYKSDDMKAREKDDVKLKYDFLIQ
ncbi:MAG: Dam family site-specific DNA-(adenine-N6)-methyltransferase [Bacteroidales bacterium]|nr:Dam family site-specific DNA-(adenine-N6)-methyltransferase [Bacteroidales bacterium]